MSRHNMREAMRDLMQEGHLYRIRGKGTFVFNLKVRVDAGKGTEPSCPGDKYRLSVQH